MKNRKNKNSGKPMAKPAKKALPKPPAKPVPHKDKGERLEVNGPVQARLREMSKEMFKN